ncbi:hypothetical protein I552_9230 [Mycobacterium xenopi 3993]|nr:hypothetical protein I552_9230 [Mycobacterium xenopi 3993]
MLSLMGHLAGPILGVGKVGLSGQTSNGQHFDANPLRIWYVSASRAVVEGEDLGRSGRSPSRRAWPTSTSRSAGSSRLVACS